MKIILSAICYISSILFSAMLFASTCQLANFYNASWYELTYYQSKPIKNVVFCYSTSGKFTMHPNTETTGKYWQAAGVGSARICRSKYASKCTFISTSPKNAKEQ